MRPSPARPALLALLAASAAACGGASAQGLPPEPPTPAEFEALYRARLDSARTRFTAADVAFVTGMIAHHAQALEMAALAPTHGASASVRTLAARIINAQQDEIARMREWLADRGQPVPAAPGAAGAAHGAGHAHPGMPGMLSAEQLAELARARGAAFDRLFLTYMIQHHRGAVEMVERLFAQDGAAQDQAIFKLASDVHVDQVTEIARMEQMLGALPAAGRDR